MANGDKIKAKAAAAVSAANKRAKAALEKGAEKAKEAGKKALDWSRKEENRRTVDAIEIAGGAAAAGASRGSGMVLYTIGDETDPSAIDIGSAGALGVALLIGGVVAKQRDAQALGLGMVAGEIACVMQDLTS